MMKKILVIGNVSHKEEIQKVERELTLGGDIVYGMHVFDEYSNLSNKDIEMLDTVIERQLCECDMLYVVKPEGVTISGRTERIMRDAAEWGRIILINGYYTSMQ